MHWIWNKYIFSFSNPAKTQFLIFYDQKFTFKGVPNNSNALWSVACNDRGSSIQISGWKDKS